MPLRLDLHALEGFYEYIPAFVQVEEVELGDCEIFRSLPDVETFAWLGSGL